LDAYGGLASSQKPNSPTRGATASLYLVLNLRDGRTLGGQLAVGDLGDDPDKRDLTLARPLWIAAKDGDAKLALDYDFVIIPGRDIASLWGIALRPQGGPASSTPSNQAQIS